MPKQELLRERLLLPPWVEIAEGVLRSSIQPERRTQAFEIEHKTELDARALPMLVHDAEGSLFVVTQLPGELRPSLLGSLFMTSYVMGMLVRYHPSLWFALIGRSKGDFMLPVLREAISVVEQRFLTLVLGQLRTAMRAPVGITEDVETPAQPNATASTSSEAVE